ncbi:MAG: chitobiase/beta-hexosaminidase C-terminal domain-containing protein, partial [Pseudomonadota bacterium]
MESRVNRKGLCVLLLFCLFFAWALSLPCLSAAADTEPPSGSMIINGGAEYAKSTSVTLTLSATDDIAVTKMRFSNDGATWGTAATYAATKTYSLPTGNGSKTVYAQFGDAVGNWSETANDSITLDSIAPVTTATPPGGTYTAVQTVTLAATDALSNVDKIYYTTNGIAPTTESPVYTGTISISATTTLMYRATDLAGNMEAAKTQKYTINDTVAPTGSVTINDGAPYTRSASVTLTFSATDNIGVTRMRFSSDGATWGGPTAYVGVQPWTLLDGDGAKTVYVQFGDAAGNWSATATDSIMLDSSAPATTASPAGGNYSAVQTVTLTATDNLSGVDTVYYTIDGTTPGTGSPVYTGPIAIPATTTLMYRATD